MQNICFKEYCAWIFDVLEKLEKIQDGIVLGSQSREAGYIAEHLFNVWLIQHNTKIKEMDVTNLDTEFYKKLGARAKDAVLKMYFALNNFDNMLVGKEKENTN